MNRAERRCQARGCDRGRHPSTGVDPVCDRCGCGMVPVDQLPWGEVAPGWVIMTDPGCSAPEHVEEVQGAMMALVMRGGVPWSGATLMDCGCTLELVEASTLD